MKQLNFRTKTSYQKFINFIYPFYPAKLFRHTQLITLLASLIAIRLVVALFSLYIPSFNLKLTFEWIPIIMMGWIYGPVIGLFAGAISDTLAWLISGTPWFWMYAIQQPIIAMMAGLVSGVATLRSGSKKFTCDLVLQQIIVLGFGAFVLVSNFLWFQPLTLSTNDSDVMSAFMLMYEYLASAIMVLFVLIFEGITIYYYLQIGSGKAPKHFINFIYASSLSVVVTFIFSFILGPIAAIKYYEFLYNQASPNFIKYGAMFYLVPRIMKESVKTPITTIVINSLIIALSPYIQTVKNNIHNKWGDVYDIHVNEILTIETEANNA